MRDWFGRAVLDTRFTFLNAFVGTFAVVAATFLVFEEDPTLGTVSHFTMAVVIVIQAVFTVVPVVAAEAVWQRFVESGGYPPLELYRCFVVVWWMLLIVSASLVCARAVRAAYIHFRHNHTDATRRMVSRVRPRRPTVVVFVVVAVVWLLLSVVGHYEMGFGRVADLGLPRTLVQACRALFGTVLLPTWFIGGALIHATGFEPHHSRFGNSIVLIVSVASSSAICATLVTTMCVRYLDWPGHRPLRRTRAKSEWETPTGLTTKRVFKIVWFAALVALGMVLLI